MSLAPVTLDLDALRDTLLRRRTPRRVQYFEHGVDARIRRELLDGFGLWAKNAPDARAAEWASDIALYRFLGMELFRVFPPGAAVPLQGGAQGWAEEHTGPIQSWADVERFPWPAVKDADLGQLEWYDRHLPGDMGVFVKVSSWEVVRELFGFESFCYALHEDPALVREVTRRVGEFYTALAEALCQFRCVFALYGCDDFGYKTATMLPPAALREHFLPWHRRWASLAHAHGKFYFLHACGRLDEIMDDLMDVVGVDAKHSFEEVITPVDEAKRLWGGRLTLLGGLDVDCIARAGETAIRAYTRRILAACMPGGGYCLGLGNWVTAYTPVEHYLWVLDEGRRFG